MKTALTIAGFDPSSGAGVTADLMVFAAQGLFGLSCITALTVQSTMGVMGTHPVAAQVVSETLGCLDADLPVDGVKIGMLATEENVVAVAEFLGRLRSDGRRAPVVLDPVVRSSSGRELLTGEGVKTLRSRLLPLVDWVTPNADELGALTGMEVRGHEDVEPAARRLLREHPGLNVFATGGHLRPPDDLVLTADGGVLRLGGEWIEGRSTHGTGCALSSALLSRLVSGDDAHTACPAAKEYVAEAIRRAWPMGHGHGPVDGLWPLRRGTERGRNGQEAQRT